MSKNRIAIVGYGAFGGLLSRILPHDLPIGIISDVAVEIPDYCEKISYENLDSFDIIFLAVPIDALKYASKEVAKYVLPATIVSDVCSVKEIPSEILHEVFNGVCSYVPTHPLFGPSSVTTREDTAGKELVWCSKKNHKTTPLRDLLVSELGLNVVDMSPTEHDKQMAWIHALTFYVGRSLLQMDIPVLSLSTGYFQTLLSLRDLESSHSEALFMTIQKGNRYARPIRELYNSTLVMLDDHIHSRQGVEK